MLNEILEIKEKLEKLVFEFDQKVRNNFIIEAKYNVPLKDIITPLLIIEGQINIHKNALKALENGMGIEEIARHVDDDKRNLISSTYTQQKKLLSYTSIIENLEKYSDSDLLCLENDYKEMVLKHHPALTLIQDPEEKQKFQIIREFYLQSNVEFFLKAKNELKFGTYEENNLTDEEALKEISIAYTEFSREFERISKFDENFAQLKTEVEDEMLLARNEANLRQRLYKAKKEIAEVFAATAEAFNGAIDFDIVKTE